MKKNNQIEKSIKKPNQNFSNRKEVQPIKLSGVVKTWIGDRGFEFIEVGDYPDVEDFFFHITSCQNNDEPQQGDCVDFQVIEDEKTGKTRASKVFFTGEYIDEQYFSYENRREIRKRIRQQQREARQQARREQRQRYMNSEKFNNKYFYERKQGYFCRRCRRELDETSNNFTCPCQNYQYDQWYR